MACAAVPVSSETKAELNFIPPGKARIVVYRTAKSLLYAGASASVSVNGKAIGECYEGSFVFGNSPAGKCVIKTDAWGSPGSCEIEAVVESGKEYHFVMNPRKQNFIATVAGGIIGAAIESDGKKCGGMFSIVPVETEVARKELTHLAPAEPWTGEPPKRTEK